jgi:multiple sugar transport system substrate-binding protein
MVITARPEGGHSKKETGMNNTKRPGVQGTGLSRRGFLAGTAAAGAALAFPMPAVLAQTKEFAGVTLNGATFQHGFQTALKALLPQFQEQTGIAVNLDIQAFAVYNQRMDLELSTQGSSYDFCNITFPFSGRWVGSGWLSPLDEFTNDPNATPADFDPADFLSGAQTPFIGQDKKTYGYAWVTGVQMMAAARGDLIDKAGLKLPTTLDELMQVCVETNSPETAAYANDKLHNWQWPPFLMGFGGKVLKDAPTDLTPVLNTPEAAKAAEYYATLLSKYGPSGVLSYTDDQVQQGQYAGRINIRTQSADWLIPLGTNPASKVKDTVRYGMFPGGPAGAFPGVNSQGFGIPAGSRQKRAAWEFIKWATSKEILLKLAVENAQLSVTRTSALNDERVKSALTINGQDVGAIYQQTVELAGKGGYMTYRTQPVFPQVGEKINKAIEQVATGQATAEKALADANNQAIADLQKAGFI